MISPVIFPKNKKRDALAQTNTVYTKGLAPPHPARDAMLYASSREDSGSFSSFTFDILCPTISRIRILFPSRTTISPTWGIFCKGGHEESSEGFIFRGFWNRI